MQWGWAPEDIVDDGGLFSAPQQGFQGSLCLPRELFVLTTTGISDTDGTAGELGTSRFYQQADGLYTAQTLGVRPLMDVVTGLRNGTTQRSFPGGTLNQSTSLVANATSHYEFQATITESTGRVGLQIAVSPDGREKTLIYYEPLNSTLVVDRSSSSLLTGFNNASVVGYFKPYYTVSQFGGNATAEPLVWNVFLDGSLLEVYLNDRFALTTRIYPSLENSVGLGVYIAEGASATFENINHWGNLYNVWPGRPLNSSSQLVFDTVAETNNYTWWAGN